MRLYNYSTWLIGVAGLSFLAGPTFAQDTAAGSEVTDHGMEMIVVTARKREETLQEYAGAITAITADQLAAAQVVNMQDIRNLVPNLYLDEALGGQTTPKIFVRGIGIDNPNESFDSPVGIYVDGVYHARAFGALSDLYDVERVEFLRGPQGTLYGRNNSAGALRVITKPPSLEELEAGAMVGFGTESQVNASGFLGGPLKEDVLGARVAFGMRSNDGFMTEVNSGQKYKKDDLFSGRGSLLYRPSQGWEVVLRADMLQDRGAGTLGASTVPAFNTDDNIFTAELNNAPTSELDVWGTSVDVGFDSDNYSVHSITAYRKVDLKNAEGDADGTSLPLLEALVQELDEHQLTQEVFITSSFEPGNLRVDWTAGLFYMDEVNDSIQSFNVFPAVFGPATTQIINLETDAFAVYGEADFVLTDRLTLTAGVRYTDESKDMTMESFNNDGSFGFEFGEGISLDKTTWKAGFDYAVSDTFFLYATAGTGFRSGGIGVNPAARSTANVVNDVFGPETATSYEAGIRSSFLNNAIRLSAGYFYVEYEDLQLAVAGAGGITVNTPDATVHGLEAELNMYLADGLSIDVTLGTQTDEIKLSALELKNTPDWQARVGISYLLPLSSSVGELTIGADISRTDDYFASTANSIFVEGYPLVNALVQWEAPNGRWGLSVSGKNLTDELYPIHGFRIVPNLLDTFLPNQPRSWFASVQISY